MDDTAPRPSSLIDMRANTAVQVVLIGVMLGAATWLLTLLINRFVVGALLCGGNAAGCDVSNAVAGNIALVLTALGGLVALVRLGVYRPLLVVVAASIVLWGLSAFLLGVQWYEALAWTVLLYAVTYTAFAWLVRPRFFLLAIVLVIIVVLASRLLPVVLR